MVKIDKASKLIKTMATITAFSAMAAIAGTANAQEKAKPAAAEQASPAQAPMMWIKYCGEDPKSKKTTCLIRQKKTSSTGQELASVMLREVKGAKLKEIVVSVLPGVLLRNGMTLQIDKGKQQIVQFEICFPNACYARKVVDANFVEQMKKGAELKITALNQRGQPIPQILSLSGFTASYDGPAVDPKKMETEQNKLEEVLKKRAEEQRQKLLEQKKKAEEEGGSKPAEGAEKKN